MLKRDYEGQICSIARALELVGDRWTLLVVRDLVLGLSRFDQLLDSLGIASNVLSDRLNRLVDQGIVERVRYSQRPERFEYRLTKKGRELGLVLLALMQWGDQYVSDKPPRIARRSGSMPATFWAGAPPERAEVVDVEVAAPVTGNSSGEPLSYLIRSSASSARACRGTARMLASVFGIFSSPRVKERRT